MQQVFEFFQRRLSAPASQAQMPQQCMLNFNFVDDAPDFDPVENVIPFHKTHKATSRAHTVGRAEACVSASQLSRTPAESKNENLVYLQEELVQKQTQRQRTHTLFQNADRSQKVRATALLDASELIKHRNKAGAYQKNVARPATNKLFNRKVAQQLNERSNREELLAKVKNACEKVSNDALINAPRFHGYVAPERHRIQIKIG